MYFQVGYDNSDFHDVYGGGGGVGRNYGNERGMRGDNPGDMRFGDQMDSQYGNYGNQGQMNMGNRRFDHGNKGTMNNRGPIGVSDFFLCPGIEISGAYCFTVIRPYVHLSVCLHKLVMKT